ncbi:MAG TPA: hypothetical protein VG225_08875 [Terracidiphilus sp.]|nr:hypothetical protein [Terracidiphilus sp.]
MPLILWEESANWEWIRQRENDRPMPVSTVTVDDGQTVSFSPCGLWERLSVPREILNSAEGPAVVLSGWRMCAPYIWTPAGLAGASSFHHSRAIEKAASASLCGLIVVIWVLVGGFPLKRRSKWYDEPGSFITMCTVASGALLIAGGMPWLAVQWWTKAPHPWNAPGGLMFAAFPSFFAGCAWFWWFGLLVWKLLRAGWVLWMRRPASRVA